MFQTGDRGKNLQWEKLCGNSPQVNIFISNTDVVKESLQKVQSVKFNVSH